MPSGTEVYGAVEIPIALNGMTVKSIDAGWFSGVFYGCSGIKSVVIPDTIECIGPNTFESCTGMKTIVIGSGVTNVGDRAFYGCSGLTSLEFQEGLITIGESAFTVCSGLKTISLPDSIISIGEYAFSHCTSLTSLELPANLITIEHMLCYSCEKMANVKIPDGVMSIADYAFANCYALTEVAIPDSVASIDECAFEYCHNLQRVIIGKDVASIGYAAFATGGGYVNWELKESNLEQVVFTGDVSPAMGNCVFGTCSDYISPNTCAYVRHDSTGWDVSIPGTWNGIRIAYMDEEPEPVTYTIAYDANGGVLAGETSVSVESGKTLVSMSTASRGGYTFEGWYTSANGGTKITTLTPITSSMTLYAHWVLATDAGQDITWTYQVLNNEAIITGGSPITGDVRFPTSIDGYQVTSIDQYAFTNNHNVTSIIIPEGIRSIGLWAFRGCTNLTSVTIPNSVTSIGDRAFFFCHSLTSVTIGNSVTSIGCEVFYYCNNLTSVTIPDSVTNIGASAFEYCLSLTSVTIGNGVTSIGGRAFDECRGLTSVTMRGDCPAVGALAFRYISSSCVVGLPVGNETYTVTNGKWQGMTVEYYDAEDASDEDFVIDNNGVLTGVGLNEATEIVVPDSVTRIAANAFDGCTVLESVAIPDSVEAIAPTAFDGCEKLWSKWFKTLERLSADEAATANEVALTVTNVVVHYVTTAAVSEAVTPSEDVGIVNVISEVSAGTAVAISSEWAAQYGEAFTAKFGSDFTAAITKPTGKRDGAGNAMMVWQDFVAGTDPTDENDKFTASITFDEDGRPIIAYSPEQTPAEAAKRKYTTYGKVKLTDKEWTPIADGEEGNYNFFKVTVEMR